MTKPKQSLKSTLRKSVMDIYRSRGHSRSNLWLVYSVKTDRDWMLPSDRQLIHWLYFLETNPKVASFNLAPEPIISHDDIETRATELDAKVLNRDGTEEWHEVKSGKVINPTDESQMQAQTSAASLARVPYIRFNDKDFKPIVKVALRWLKALSFASAIRNQDHNPCRTVLALLLKDRNSGDVGSLLKSMSEFDDQVVLGMIVRLAIEGTIDLNLKTRSFGLTTPWKYNA